FAQLDLGEVGRKAERHVLALAAEEIDQHAAARDGAGHVLEYEAGRIVAAHRHPGNDADLVLPAEALDLPHFAQPLRLGKPLAKVMVGEMRGSIRSRASRVPRSVALRHPDRVSTL